MTDEHRAEGEGQQSDAERQRAEQREQRAQQQKEQREQAKKDADEQAEKDKQAREEARAAANKHAEAALEAQDEAEPADVYTDIQNLETIRQQLSGNQNIALSHIATALLRTLKYKQKQDAADAHTSHLHGRNVIPGMKTHIPAAAEVPLEIATTRRDRPVEQWEIDDAREREEAQAKGEDVEKLREEQAQRRREETGVEPPPAPRTDESATVSTAS